MSQFIEMFGNQNTNDKGWTESLVKDEFKLSMGKTPARNNPECWDNGTHKWVSISDMSSYTRYTGDTSEYITDYAIADSGIKAVPKGTIIMSFKLSIGRTAITSEDLYTNEAIMAFAGFDEKKFNIDFLHFLIANKNWLLGAKQAVKGQTLNKESIGNAKIIIPPIEAQEEFASIYNQADKSEFVGCKSQFIEMFKGDNQVPLGDICNIEKGATITRNDVLHGEVPVVAGGQEPSCYHNVANREAGAITVSASGAYAGYINFWNCPIFASDCNTIISKDDEKTDQTFVYFGLRAMQKQIYGLQKGGAQPHVYGKDLQKFMFPCPSYAKQIEFSKMAKQADKSEFELRKSIEAIDQVIKSLINN